MQAGRTGQEPRCCRLAPVWGPAQDAAVAVAGGVGVVVDVDVLHNAGGVAVVADTAGAAGARAAATTASACDDDDDDVPCYLARMVPSPGRFPTLRFATEFPLFRIRTLVANLISYLWTMRWL